MEFEKQLEEWMKLDYVLPEDPSKHRIVYGIRSLLF